MSVKSKKSSVKIDRPFKADLLKQARAVVRQYQVILNQEDDHWYGRGLELPMTFGDGETVEACIADTVEAMVASVALMLEEGQRPPTPAREGKRTEQVNIRLSAEEKLRLETIAEERGYRGLGDYMRAAALEHAR